MAKEFADSLDIPYIETSAKDSTNVKEAFIQLAIDIKDRLVGKYSKMKKEGGITVVQKELYNAIADGSMAIVKVILKAYRKDTQDKDGMTPLHVACEQEKVDLVKALIEMGVDKEIPDKRNRNALMIAATRGNQIIVRTLIVGSAKPLKSWTLLHVVTIRGDVNVVQWELKQNVILLDKQDEWGRTALWWAGVLNAVEIVQVLISAGASITKRDNTGWTPLLTITWKGNINALKVLLSAGASID